MNNTVKRIVELLFEDAVMTDEIQTMKDEVMNNCQEHFEDLIRRGMMEDEAIGAVVESLKGMEEVIAEYPQRGGKATDEANDVGDGCSWQSNAAGVRRINADVAACDLTIRTSDENELKVLWEDSMSGLIKCEITGDTLNIRVEDKENGGQAAGNDIWSALCKMRDGSRTWNGFGDMFRDFREMGRKMVTMTKGGWMTVMIPATVCEAGIHTTCGNITVNNVCLREMELTSTSGDVAVENKEAPAADLLLANTTSGDIRIAGGAERMKLNTTSGDIEAKPVNAGKVDVNTMSGDVSFSGQCPVLTANTVSGDLELEGVYGLVSGKTVSGDLELDVSEGRVDQVNVQTTSGDVDVILPRNEDSVHVELHSVSGDLVNHVGDAGLGARVQIRIQSVSGDVSVC